MRCLFFFFFFFVLESFFSSRLAVCGESRTANVFCIAVASLAALGPAADTLPAGNFFMNRETAAVFAAASPFANMSAATGNTAFSNAQMVSTVNTSIPCETTLVRAFMNS